MTRVLGARALAGTLLAAVTPTLLHPAVATAQGGARTVVQSTTPQPGPGSADAELVRALDLEGASRPREAAVAFRRALALVDPTRATETHDAALLGLERVWSELAQPDSMLPIVAAALQQRPSDRTAHAIALRTLVTTHRDLEARVAYERWRGLAPSEVSPYLEYVRLLLDSGARAAADTVLAEADRAPITAESRRLLVPLRARSLVAAGAWVDAARAWREVVVRDPEYSSAVLFSLRSAPDSTREPIVALFAPTSDQHAVEGDVTLRRVAAGLLVLWHRPAAAWAIASTLPRDTASLELWRGLAAELDASGARRDAADAWERVLQVSAPLSGDAREARLRAADDALQAGEPARALALLDGAPRAGGSTTAGGGAPRGTVQDSMSTVPRVLRVQAFAAAGRLDEAERLAADLPASTAAPLADALANSWIARGDLPRARAVLARVRADSGEAAGWIALAGGDLRGARAIFAHAPPPLTARAGLLSDVRGAARAALARSRADSAPALGEALLAAARGDAPGSVAALERAARALPDAGAPLLATAASIAAGAGDRAHAVALWQQLIAAGADAPEAPEAELAWARALLASGDRPAARTHLEHLIVTYPESALVPIARRELERLGTA